MTIQTEWIRYGAESEFLGFLAWPERASGELPAVVVIQEAFGVDAHIEDVTRRIAAAGYLALAPDLFAQRGERPPHLNRERMVEFQSFLNKLLPGGVMDQKARDAELADYPKDLADRIRETFAALFAGGTLNLDQYLPALLAASDHLRNEHPLSRGQRVGAIGFCLGGGLSGLLACHDSELAATVIFYGTPPQEAIVPRIACPLLGFYGATDLRIANLLPAFVDALNNAGKPFEHHVYEGVGHAFFNDSRPSYDVRAARDAWVRTLEHFHRTLG